LKNELEFLKSQIQPHFFFNTLNNLYSLTLKKSDLAPEVVVKLSDLMSYMLYESDSLETTLRKEVEHIKNYLDLEGLRFGKRLHLNFDIIGEVDKRKYHHFYFYHLSKMHLSMVLLMKLEKFILKSS
jgi:LytS/YehU family sensor histidine kinase